LSGSSRGEHQQDKTNLDLLEQETVSGSCISWAMQTCTSLQTDNNANASLLIFIGWMHFLLPNQQHQSTEESSK